MYEWRSGNNARGNQKRLEEETKEKGEMEEGEEEEQEREDEDYKGETKGGVLSCGSEGGGRKGGQCVFSSLHIHLLQLLLLFSPSTHSIFSPPIQATTPLAMATRLVEKRRSKNKRLKATKENAVLGSLNYSIKVQSTEHYASTDTIILCNIVGKVVLRRQRTQKTH